MDLQVLNPDASKLFLKFGVLNSLKKAYLAGGTALALQLSHRKSYDFDFFTKKLPELDVWRDEMSQVGRFKLTSAHERDYLGKFNSAQVSITSFPFTILDRTRKRDIYDLYFLAQKFDLDEMLIFFEHKFEGVEISEPVILKSLTDLNNIPDEPIDLIKQVDWDEVKRFWQQEVKRYVKDTSKTSSKTPVGC